MQKKIISALMVIVVALILSVGATFALFTSEKEVDVTVGTGKVNINATINDNYKTYSFGVLQDYEEFANGGTAVLDDASTFILTKMLPGDKLEFTINVTNTSDVAVEYRVAWEESGNLTSALVATANGSAIVNGASAWETWAAPANGSETKTITVVVELPVAVGNEFQDKDANIVFIVQAVQAGGSAYL